MSRRVFLPLGSALFLAPVWLTLGVERNLGAHPAVGVPVALLVVTAVSLALIGVESRRFDPARLLLLALVSAGTAMLANPFLAAVTGTPADIVGPAGALLVGAFSLFLAAVSVASEPNSVVVGV